MHNFVEGKEREKQMKMYFPSLVQITHLDLLVKMRKIILPIYRIDRRLL